MRGARAHAERLATWRRGRWRRAAPARADDAACPPATPAAGPGSVDPFRAPAPEATALNAAALTLYRQGHWDEARAKYRAAEQADGEFLAPALNVACSFVRQERFDEATAEVLRLLDRAYIPWSREVLTAADLGALKVQPQMADVKRAMAEDARRWGAGLENDLLFVGAPARAAEAAADRRRRPSRWCWCWACTRRSSPGRRRPIAIASSPPRTATSWRWSSSPDRRHLLYVTAEKLVRNPKGPPTLRGVVLHVLMLPLMTVGKPIPIAGDVTRLVLAPAPAGFAIAIEGDRDERHLLAGQRRRADGAGAPARRAAPQGARRADRGRRRGRRAARGGRRRRVSPDGATPESRDEGRGSRRSRSCPRASRRRAERADAPKTLRTRFGAGLDGLSIP